MALDLITTALTPATAVAPAGPYDLTDLATAHDELGIPTSDTGNDAFLSRAITQASAAISRYCNRVFAIEGVQDFVYIEQDPYPFQVPGGVEPLQLSRWPLVSGGAPQTFKGNTYLNSVLVDGIASTANLYPGTPVSAIGIPAGTTIAAILGSTSLNLSAAATAAGSQVTVSTGLSAVQVVTPAQNGGQPTFNLLATGVDFTVDYQRGWLLRLNKWTGVQVAWEAMPVIAQYQAGYASSPAGMPADLIDACLRLVTQRFKSRGRDPMQMTRTQPGIGEERFWVGAQRGQNGVLPPEIEALVERYRVPIAL